MTPRITAGCAALLLLAATAAGEERQEKPLPPPLSWRQCVETAWKQNPQINTAWQEVEQTEGTIIQKEAIFYPDLSASGGAFPPFMNISVQQLVFSRAMAPILRAETYARAIASLNYHFTVHNVIFQARTQYLTVLYFQNQAAIRERYLKILEKNAVTLPMLYEGGRALRSDVVRLDVNLALARDRLRQSRLNGNIAKLALFDVMGLPPGEAADALLSGTLDPTLPADLDAKKLTDLALRDRLDLQLLRELRKLDIEEVAIASAAVYPQVGGYGLYNATDHTPDFLTGLGDEDSLSNDDVSKARLGFLATWVLFDGGATRGKEMALNAKTEKREVLIADLETRLPGEVTVAISSLRSSYDSWASIEKGRGLGAESVALANIEFDRGEATQVELLKAEQDAVAREESAATALYKLELSKLALLRSTGQIIRLVIGSPKEAKNQ